MATPGKSHYNAGKVRVEEISGSNKAIAATETGEVYMIHDPQGVTVTLPPVSNGAYFKFIITHAHAVTTAGEIFHLETADSSEHMKGSCSSLGVSGANPKVVVSATNNYRLKIGGTGAHTLQQGSVIECIADNLGSWAVRADLTVSNVNVSGTFH